MRLCFGKKLLNNRQRCLKIAFEEGNITAEIYNLKGCCRPNRDIDQYETQIDADLQRNQIIAALREDREPERLPNHNWAIAEQQEEVKVDQPEE